VLFNDGDDIEPTVSVRCLGVKGIIPAYLVNKKQFKMAHNWRVKLSLQSSKILVPEMKYLILNAVLISSKINSKLALKGASGKNRVHYMLPKRL